MHRSIVDLYPYLIERVGGSSWRPEASAAVPATDGNQRGLAGYCKGSNTGSTKDFCAEKTCWEDSADQWLLYQKQTNKQYKGVGKGRSKKGKEATVIV